MAAVALNDRVGAVRATQAVAQSADRLFSQQQRVAAGRRIVEAADDPSGLVIDVGLRAQIRSLARARQNTQQALHISRRADAGMAAVGQLLGEVRGLVLEQASANGFGDDERQQALDQALRTIDRIAVSTRFAAFGLLDGRRSVQTSLTGSGVQAISVRRIAVPADRSDLEMTLRVEQVATLGRVQAEFDPTTGALTQNTTVRLTTAHGTQQFTWGAGASTADVAQSLSQEAVALGLLASATGGTLTLTTREYGAAEFVRLELRAGGSVRARAGLTGTLTPLAAGGSVEQAGSDIVVASNMMGASLSTSGNVVRVQSPLLDATVTFARTVDVTPAAIPPGSIVLGGEAFAPNGAIPSLIPGSSARDFATDGTRLFVTNEQNRLYEIDPLTGVQLQSWNLSTAAYGLTTGGTIYGIEIVKGIGQGGQDVLFLANRTRLYARLASDLSRGGFVDNVADPANFEVQPVPQSSYGGLTYDGTSLINAKWNTSTLHFFNPATLANTQSIQVRDLGGTPISQVEGVVAYKGNLFVTDFGNSKLFQIDPATGDTLVEAVVALNDPATGVPINNAAGMIVFDDGVNGPQLFVGNDSGTGMGGDPPILRFKTVPAVVETPGFDFTLRFRLADGVGVELADAVNAGDTFAFNLPSLRLFDLGHDAETIGGETVGGRLDSLLAGRENDLRTNSDNALVIVDNAMSQVLEARGALGSMMRRFLEPNDAMQAARGVALEGASGAINGLDLPAALSRLATLRAAFAAATPTMLTHRARAEQVLSLLG